jgi:putative ABC transport system ATP-binding protein
MTSAMTEGALYVLREVTKVRAGVGTSFELSIPNLVIRPREITAVCSISGSGKSTLLDLLAMILRPDGAVRFAFARDDGMQADIDHLWRSGQTASLGSLRAGSIGYVLQTGGLLSFLTVRDNIVLPARITGRDSRMRLAELAEQLGIAHCLDRRPHQISVGERQRVAIARAVIHQPRVVLADEPTASVDPLNADRIFALLIDLVSSSSLALVIASHDWDRIERNGMQRLHHRLERSGERTRSLFWN